MSRAAMRARSLTSVPAEEGRELPLIINIHGGAFRMGSKADGVPVRIRARLRRGFDRLSLERRRDLAGPDRGLQGGGPVASRQRGEIRARSGPLRRLGRFRRGASGRDARHDRRGQGVRDGREPERVQPRASGRGLFRSDRLPADGRAPAAQRTGPRRRSRRSRSSSAGRSRRTKTRWPGPIRSPM